jgi:cyclopropane-fatty-acyl-phospholipid synthase
MTAQTKTGLPTAAGRQGAIGWAESGVVPDPVIRAGIRRLNRQRLAEIKAHDPEESAREMARFVAHMQQSPVALVPELANEQHYEVPAAFFAEVMGVHRKYSCCHWGPDARSLDDAERQALQISCERAGLQDGMDVLELGCGWGSLSLWIAEQYPNSRLLAVSNSNSQREYIQETARQRQLDNIEVRTCDMNDFSADRAFDRVVSVEMFEHMRNYAEMFRRIAGWLKPGGRFFMHVFCHRKCVYAFEDKGPSDWMSRHFFSGGIMPSADLPLRFQRDLNLVRSWQWSGTHYEKTANAWLKNTDQNRKNILPILEATYGAAAARQWLQRWRIFFMACAELFGHDQGREWLVGHYLFERGLDARARSKA